MSNSASRVKQKESFWRRLIRDQAGSGLSIKSWCHQHGRKESAFYWWRAELARRDGSRPQGNRTNRMIARRQHAFVPVRVVEDEARGFDGRIEIIMPGGARVQVVGRVERQTLADVLAALIDGVGDERIHAGRADQQTRADGADRRTHAGCTRSRESRPC